jgi:hypothetical protein
MKAKLNLASTLAIIGREADAIEDKATSVLRIVRQRKIEDLKGWNAAVREAYAANNWNSAPGKPKTGSTTTTVPTTVKQYVSAVRRAFRAGLPVATYSSFHALRTELRKRTVRKAKAAAAAAPVSPEMVGISLKQPDALNGGPFHDLVALYGALDRTRKPKMLGAVQRIVREFSPAAPQLVLQSLPEMRRAA